MARLRKFKVEIMEQTVKNFCHDLMHGTNMKNKAAQQLSFRHRRKAAKALKRMAQQGKNDNGNIKQ